MTQNLESLKYLNQTLTSIRGIVHTMKTLSAINALPYEHAARSISAYHATVLKGFSAFFHRHGPVAMLPGGVATHVVVAFGSDQGLCGNYNQTVAIGAAQFLAPLRAADTNTRVLCVGARMKDALAGQGVSAESTLLPPASADGIERLAGELVTRLDDIRRETLPGEVAVSLAFMRASSDGLSKPIIVGLLPLDHETIATAAQPWMSRSLPDYTMAPDDLFAALIRSHLFASVFRAAADALVTENAARLAQMQQAEKSVDKRLEELKTETRIVRQSEITTELLDVIIGFEALKRRGKKRGKHL